MPTRAIISCLVLALIATRLLGAGAAVTNCARCGCVAPCKKCCRLVFEEKSVEVECWGCKCEQFCLPGHGCPKCEHCKCVCEDCQKDAEPSGVCSQPKAFHWLDWIPTGAPQMYTKTKLMKRVETVKVPSYKWVVEDVCYHCCRGADGCNEQDVAATDGKGKPKLPQANTK